MIPSLRNRHYMQLCWVVPDLEQAIHHWVRTAAAGPFFLFEDLHFENGLYRGAPSDIEPCRAAIGQFGDVQIELVTPVGTQGGLWSDFTPGGKTVLHHAGLYCADFAAEHAAYAEAGIATVFEGLMMGARTAYLDTMETLGFLTELITANPVAEQVFGAFRAASEGWDGRDPVRTL